ncbi:MAG: hypothetical protein ACKVOO_01505 [Burkholderiaceae bacterium]
MKALLTATVCVAGIVLLQGSVLAQSQECFTKDGTSYSTTRGCPKGTTAGPVYYGPAQDRPTSTRSSSYESRSSYTPSSAPEADYAKLLGGRCRSLYDGIRNADRNGLRYEAKSELQMNYSRECSEEESEARRQMNKDRYEGRRERLSSARAENSLVENEKKSSAAHFERCAESRRILNTKKARTDLNDGEKAELKRFEENYINRCS